MNVMACRHLGTTESMHGATPPPLQISNNNLVKPAVLQGWQCVPRLEVFALGIIQNVFIIIIITIQIGSQMDTTLLTASLNPCINFIMSNIFMSLNLTNLHNCSCNEAPLPFNFHSCLSLDSVYGQKPGYTQIELQKYMIWPSKVYKLFSYKEFIVNS